MTPGARIQAVIELLSEILPLTKPADQVITGYFRQKRFIGSSDRRDISETTYHILRNRLSLVWLGQQVSLVGSDDPASQARILALIYLICEKKANLQTIFDGEKYSPSPLTKIENLVAQRLPSVSLEKAPLYVQLNLPEWLLQRFQQTFQENLADEVAALNRQASLDLRVNTLKTTREEVLATLKKEGIQATETPWSPVGIRLAQRRPLPDHPLWQRGLIEVQDEGSQLVSRLTDVKPGMMVLDYCAGAGGKTLSMAAMMKNQGRIMATDTVSWRLDRSRERLRRAGVHNVECRVLNEAGNRWIKRQANRFDRVLVDVPCSGTGTWRRNPDLKGRLSESDLTELLEKQHQILTTVAPLLKKGGRLIYVTCSVLRAENHEQIERFLAEHDTFKVIPYQQVSDQLSLPITDSDLLQLTPHQHNVDGFFCAVLERVS